MELNEYQEKAVTTKLGTSTLGYMILALVGEAGEVANKYKKVLRGDTTLTPEVIDDLGSELGDVLWYVACAAELLGMDLDEIATWNLEKLKDRQARGVIKGTGDKR